MITQCAAIFAFALRPSPVVQFLQKQTNPAFKGLYQVNGFDMMLLVPYFIVLVILAGYGFHRYQLVWMYYRHRKNKTTTPQSTFAELPRVTIQLPIFNEQFVVDRLVESICNLDYPRELLDIQLLDDSTDETVAGGRRGGGQLSRAGTRHCARPPHRPHRL